MKSIHYIFPVLITLLACDSSDIERSQPQLLDDCKVEIQDTVINAGETMTLVINCSSETRDTLYLILSNTLGELIYPVGIENGIGSVTINDAILKQSGVISYELVHNKSTYDSGSFMVNPLDPMGLLETYAGPKTIISGGVEEAMMIAVPVDTFGNVVEETVIQFGLVTPLMRSTSKNPIYKLTAYQRYKSNKTTGKWYIGAETGQSNSLEEHIYVTPASPQDFKIEVIQNTPFADGRTISMISTSSLKDEYDNTVSDGTVVHFYMMEEGKIISAYQAQTIGGKARLYFEHPDRAMNVSVQSNVTDIASSNILSLSFESILKDFKATYNKDSKLVRVGPLRGVLGQYLPDGFRVDFHVAGSEYDKWIYKQSENGFCELILTDQIFIPGNYKIDIYVGGISNELMIEWE
jgi:hypothetical protein